MQYKTTTKAILAAILSCQLTPLLIAQDQKAADSSKWPQVFTDDFNRGGVLGVDFFEGNWVSKSGKWDVAGELKGSDNGATVMCTRLFKLPFRIEYECSSDNPGDLSLQFNTNLDKVFCYVGFGSEYNTENRIWSGNEKLAMSKENLIEPGRRHKVVVEATETTVRQIIDGKETLKAAMNMPKRGLYFGFSIWNPGAFRNIKVYSPNALETGKVVQAQTAPAVSEASVCEFKSFEDWPVGAMAGTNCVVKSGEKCSVKIADVPTWLYYNVKTEFRDYRENEDPAKADEMMKSRPNKGSYFVSDHCVELASENTDGKAQASISFPVPPMRNGLVEFDVMADQYTGDALRVKLSDKISLLIDKDGNFCWEAGAGKVKLADKIQYHGIHGVSRFYLQPQRWFTVRIDYDTAASLANAAVVNLYCYKYYPKGGVNQYFPLGEDLPLPADAVANITFETAGAGRFYIDNLFFISRTPDLADDAQWKVAAKEIMKPYYHQRKDPLSLGNFSLRNVRNMVGSGCPAGDELDDLLRKPDQYPVILDSARQYNQIMIRQAFLAEKLKGLERVYFYLSSGDGSEAGKFNDRILQARQSVGDAGRLLASLYNFYADCYLDSLNQAKMKDGFAARHAELNSAIDKSEALIQALYMDMRPKSFKEAADIACRYEPQADWDSLTFSDGSHKRGGKKEFLFMKTPMLWPYMDKALLFPNLRGLGIGHLLRDLKEPGMCNASTNTYIHQVCEKSTGELCSLGIDNGQHYQFSSLPKWWTEKYKEDRDLFLQNVKGEIAEVKTYSDNDSGPRQQFNYWNPKVLAAQKAMLGGMVDALAGYNLDIPKRVININMAQEAWLPLMMSGGLWEAGYNPTAVQAFRDNLKKIYGNITELNTKWGSQYTGFDDIKPPDDFSLKPRPVPSGLAYEFERFRMKSWSDWLRQCHAWMQEKLPQQTPNSCDVSYPMLSCQDAIDGFDTVKLFETFDIVMEHYQQQFADDPQVYRYLENLRQAFNSSTGCGEWYVAGPDDVFNEQACMNNGLRQCYQFVQWGRNMILYWGGHDMYWITGGNWTEGRLGHTIFRYWANYIPLSIARARAHQQIYLECPLVQPDVGVLESETSFYNVMNVRGGVSEFSSLLFSKGHDFGFLFERLIMDGRQKLDNYKVLILPNALALPEVFTRKLMDWVEKGGTLIATGPVGAWNEYGQTNGVILDKVIGKGNWTCEGRIFKLKENLPDTATCEVPSLSRCKIVYRKEMSFLVEGQLGQGKVFIRQGSLPADMIYGLISANAPRMFYGEGNKFHLAMRQDVKGTAGKSGDLYLAMLNPDVYQTLADEIVLKGEYKEVADISCNFPIVPSIKDGVTRFKVKLGPAEGIMIRIKQ